jgi:GDP-4-dehydro-6-deoxy-D-mannose reductase
VSYARILMTGASGFVGRWLAPALQAAYPTSAFAAVLHHPSDGYHGWTAFHVDLVDAEAVAEAVRAWKPSLVIHLAAQSSVGRAPLLAEETWRTNGVGALNLAVAVARMAPKAMVFNVSTGEVYGSSFLNGSASETTPISPRTIYARSKAAGELIFEDVLSKESRLVTVRPLNHTGAGQDERFVLPSFAAQIARIEAGLAAPTLFVGNIGVERDFLDVHDVIDAYVLILAGARSLPQRSCFNVASGQPRRISELLELMVRASSRPFEVQIDSARIRPVEIPRMVGDATALRRKFGWAPKRSVDELLGGLMNYWRSRISAELTGAERVGSKVATGDAAGDMPG